MSDSKSGLETSSTPTEREARLDEACLAIASERTFARIAEATALAIERFFEAKARVTLLRHSDELAAWPERPLGDEAEHLALSASANGLRASLEIAVDARGLDAEDRVALTRLGRMAVATLERSLLAKDVEESTRKRHEIVTIVSHDLRTPLQTFAMGLDAIELSVDPAAQKRIASTTARMKRSIATMTRLLGDLLDISRIHDGALPLKLAETSLGPLVEAVREQHRPTAEKNGVSLSAEVDAGLTLRCDEARLTQALGNVVANSIRHTERGSIAITARASANERVQIAVVDTGTGMSKEIRARLFDRLFRGDPSSQTGGVGMGLFLAHGIVVAHGGTITIESEVGRGTTVTIELPVKSAREPQPG